VTGSKQIVIKATELFDGKDKRGLKYVIIEGNKIIDVIDRNPRGCQFCYEGYVTPAFIDAHSHIGMCRHGEPSAEEEANDISNQFLPLLNPLDSIYFDDHSFVEAVDFGVLYSCVVPGSGNLIGGKAMVIKNFARNRKDALIKDHGYKMALGYNPRSTPNWKGERPNSRMGLAALLTQKFEEFLRKQAQLELSHSKQLIELEKEKKDRKLTSEEFEFRKGLADNEFNLEFSAEEMALREILSGAKTIKCHVHKADDVLFLVELVKKYGLKVTAEHLGDVFEREIFDELAENNIPIVYGPLDSLAYKVELKHASYKNAGLLMRSKAFYGLMTDHPVVLAMFLRESLKFFLIQGMGEAEAISLITHKNAKILGIDDILGTVEPGKLASLIVWDKNPLHLAARPLLILGEGKILRKS
jgi:imidazolonepropionase-like amidohydrolase